MNFYSNVAAGRPYSEHKHYPFPYGELIISYGDGTTRKYHCYPGSPETSEPFSATP